MTYSLYIHIPFCSKRCTYCDFNTYAGLENLIPAYVSAVSQEMRMLGAAAAYQPDSPAGDAGRLPVHTVFLGGGTPSLLPVSEMERILSAAREAFDLLPGAEISVEANPGTVDLEALRGLRELGVNRLSLGMQSAQAGELELLGRIHTFPQVVQAVEWARAAGFDNLNLDVIFGLPEQSLSDWEGTLRQALGLGVEHLSLYALTLEEGTPLLEWVRAGRYPEPDPDLAADMYDLATEMLAGAGFLQYEISNWARGGDTGRADVQNPRYACRHNLQYWRNLPYLGVGAGAHGYIGMRIANVLTPGEYIRRIREAEGKPIIFPQSPAAAQVTPIDEQTEIGETMMMGLRLTREGVSQAAFRERFGRELVDVYGKPIDKLMKMGLLEWAGAGGDVLRITKVARFIGNRVFVEFI